MAKEWTYRSGDWWLICDVCSKKIHASESKHRWDGFIVCPDCFETRHPQDFVRTKKDKISVPFSRPRTEDVFISNTYGGGFGDAVLLREELLPTITAGRILTETTTVIDLLSYTVVGNYNITLSDSISMSDNLGVQGQLSYTLLDTTSISDSMSYTLGVYNTQVLEDVVVTTDSISYLLTTGSALINSSAINTFTLG